MALMKNLKLAEQVNFTLRAEAFNFFNHTNFSTIGTTRPLTAATSSSTYNHVTGTRDPRILQLAAKFTF